MFIKFYKNKRNSSQNIQIALKMCHEKFSGLNLDRDSLKTHVFSKFSEFCIFLVKAMASQPCKISTFVDFEDKIDSNLKDVKEEDSLTEKDSGIDSSLGFNDSAFAIEGEVEIQQDESDYLTTYTFAELDDVSQPFTQYTTYARIQEDQMGVSRIYIDEGKYSFVR